MSDEGIDPPECALCDGGTGHTLYCSKEKPCQATKTCVGECGEREICFNCGCMFDQDGMSGGTEEDESDAEDRGDSKLEDSKLKDGEVVCDDCGAIVSKSSIVPDAPTNMCLQCDESYVQCMKCSCVFKRLDPLHKMCMSCVGNSI